MEKIKITKKLLVQLFLDSDIPEGKYNMSDNYTNYPIGTLTYKNGTIDFNVRPETSLVYSHEEEIIRNIINKLIDLEKQEDVEQFYYFNQDLEVCKSNTQAMDENAIQKLKKINNYFPANKISAVQLKEALINHIQNNAVNILNTFHI